MKTDPTFFWLPAILLFGTLSQANTGSLQNSAAELTQLRKQIIRLEERIGQERDSEKNARRRVLTIQKLQRLQILEKSLGQKRLLQLERALLDLSEKKNNLSKGMEVQKGSIFQSLRSIEITYREEMIEKLSTLDLGEQEKIEAPRRRTLAKLIERGVQTIKTLQADSLETAKLQSKIEQEKSDLSYLFQDLKEQEKVLELNRLMEVELLKKNRDDRISQLETYRKLKSSQVQVENLMDRFNAGRELTHAVKYESALNGGVGEEKTFISRKGTLGSPLSAGRIASQFGRVYDAKSGLYVFKKGIDILGSKNQAVFAVSPGKVVFSGDLPEYGSTVIIDHGHHYYTLCAHLGEITRPTNAFVREGEAIGKTDKNGTPLYFEIRSRNVAVNPLQWMNI